MIAEIEIVSATLKSDRLDDSTVADYAAAIKDGATFPPVIVFFDGSAYWLADGFHRFHAHRHAGSSTVAVDVRQGTKRDAILHSVGANASHGLRRTNEDKRRAVLTLLNDPEWSQWSDGEIAKRCAVSREYVNRLRPAVTCDQVTSERSYVTKHGTTAQMDTAKIGKAGDAAQDVDSKARQIEFDRQQKEARAALNPAVQKHIQQQEQAKADAIAARKAASTDDGLSPEDRVAELEEAISVLEKENAELKAENKLYGEMKAQFLQGGFDKVVAGKDAEIRALETRLYRESEDKASWMRSANYWQEQAKKLGFSRNAVIDIETGEIISG